MSSTRFNAFDPAEEVRLGKAWIRRSNFTRDGEAAQMIRRHIRERLCRYGDTTAPNLK